MARLGYLSPSALSIENHVAVLPCGGLSDQALLLWKDSDLERYVSFYSRGFVYDRMFGGFVFNGITVGSGRFLHPIFVGFGEPSNLQDWNKWLECLFAPAANLNALYEVAKRHERDPLDVWVSLPYPHSSQSNFGKVDGTDLNFLLDDHRYQALVWWIDAWIHHWKKHTQLHQKLVFRGFMWQREAIDAIDESLVKRINQYITAKSLFSLWLPNFGSYGYNKSHLLGFKVTAMGSNYYGNSPYDHNWIHHANKLAQVQQLGLQITYGKGLIYSEHHLLDYLNLMLINQAMHDCFFVYQFPNQTINDIYMNQNVRYKQLYAFIKGTYKKTLYPGIAY